jgi:hypothetical protein
MPANERRAAAWMDLRMFLAVDDLGSLVTPEVTRPLPAMGQKELSVLDRLFPGKEVARDCVGELHTLESVFARLEWA